MLKWPDRAKAAILKLFQPLQDIDVYVEDTNDEVFYRTILGRISGENLKIARVLGLGGRKAVIEAALSYTDTERRALFLIDGDLEWVRGVPFAGPRNLHRHPAYCVENLILCETAVTLLVSQDVVVLEDEAKLRINFNTWLSEISEPLISLFAAYATANEFCPEYKTVSCGVGTLCVTRRKNSPKLARQKVITATRNALQAAADVVGQERTDLFYQETLTRIRKLPRPFDAISGKDFLLPLLHFHIQDIGCRPTKRAFRQRLATSCETKAFDHLRGALNLVAAKATAK